MLKAAYIAARSEAYAGTVSFGCALADMGLLLQSCSLLQCPSASLQRQPCCTA